MLVGKKRSDHRSNKQIPKLLIYLSPQATSVFVNTFRYPEKVKSLVAHAGQSYISEKDMEKMMNVIDVSNWSPRMREPMEAIYGKVLKPKNIYVEMSGLIT